MEAPPSTKLVHSNTLIKLINLQYPSHSTDFHFEFNHSKKINVHKELLSLLSAPFGAMFTGFWAEKTHAKIDDVEFYSFESFMQYFYTGKVELHECNVHEIVYLAKKYLIDDDILIISCETFMIECLTLKSVVQNLNWAILYDLHDLRNACARLISTRIVEFIEAFIMVMDLEQKMLLTILEGIPIGVLNKHRQQIYDFCIRWAKHHTLTADEDASCIEKVREKLGDVYELICSSQKDADAFIERYTVMNQKYSAQSPPDNITIFELPKCKRRLYSLSEHPKTNTEFRLENSLKLLGVRIAPFYERGITTSEYLDRIASKSTAYCGRVRLFGFAKEVASFPFNGNNRHVTFLNEQNQPGVLLEPSVIYSLHIEINTQHDGYEFDGYSFVGKKNDFGYVGLRRSMENDVSALSDIYFCEA